jgi:glycolate oxidase
MKPFKEIDANDISAFEGIMPGRVLTGDKIAEDYERDEMTEYGRFRPDAVLLCESAGEVCRALRYCNKKNIAVTPRGAGTGLCGGCVATEKGALLSTERMNRVLEIDSLNMTMTVEPGVLLMDLPAALEGTGLFYPPDPGEKTATLGGNVMTNAGGMRAVRYGVTRDYVLGMDVALADGEILTLGGKTMKNASGYSLLDLMIGSEGTLGVLTAVTLRLIPEPVENITVLAPFANLHRCIEAVPHVLACGELTAVEFMQRGVIAAAESYLGKRFPHAAADAYLLIRLDGEGRAALEPALDRLTGRLLDLGAEDVLLADTDERKTAIWDARGAFLEAINSSTPSMDECDVVVPRDKIADFLRKSVDIAGGLGLRIQSFGHAGDGNLHVYACKDAWRDAEWEAKRAAMMAALYAEARALGGEVSGEHGIGHAKVGFLRESAGAAQMRLMRGIKAAFDPMGILNPGKVVGYPSAPSSGSKPRRRSVSTT